MQFVWAPEKAMGLVSILPFPGLVTVGDYSNIIRHFI